MLLIRARGIKRTASVADSDFGTLLLPCWARRFVLFGPCIVYMVDSHLVRSLLCLAEASLSLSFRAILQLNHQTCAQLCASVYVYMNLFWVLQAAHWHKIHTYDTIYYGNTLPALNWMKTQRKRSACATNGHTKNKRRECAARERQSHEREKNTQTQESFASKSGRKKDEMSERDRKSSSAINARKCDTLLVRAFDTENGDVARCRCCCQCGRRSPPLPPPIKAKHVYEIWDVSCLRFGWFFVHQNGIVSRWSITYEKSSQSVSKIRVYMRCLFLF